MRPKERRERGQNDLFRARLDQIAGVGVGRSASEACRPGGAVECAEQAEVDVFGGRARLLRCAADRS